MDSRYYRPSSPRRLVNPGRSSTGTFYDSYQGRGGNVSPGSSGERIAAPSTSHRTYVYAPSSSSSRSSNAKYDAYSGRPRRNTLEERDDRRSRARHSLTIPVGSHTAISHANDRPSSPLARSWDSRGEYVSHAPARREHKKIYSVDDNNSAKLIAEADVDPRKREGDPVGHKVAHNRGRSYHTTKPLVDDSYSYTNAAGMFRDTEPVWRHSRSNSIDRGKARPTSMIVERAAPRASAREQGPPPSTRGFEKIHSGLGRSGSLRERPRSSSRERSAERNRHQDPYESDSYAPPLRHTSTRRRQAPTVHQNHREHVHGAYPDDYDRRERDTDIRHYRNGRFEDADVTNRGFGIRTEAALVPRERSLDRQPIWNAQEAGRAVPEEYREPAYYPLQDLRRTHEVRAPETRVPREREYDDYGRYDERVRERDTERRHRDLDDRGRGPSAVPAVVGAAGAYGAVEALDRKSHDGRYERERRKEREVERERGVDRERHVDRERGPERERDRVRDRVEERTLDRELVPEERHALPAPGGYAPVVETDRKSRSDRDRERQYENGERIVRHRRVTSSDEDGPEWVRQYADNDVDKDASGRGEEAPRLDTALDADEEYRRRIEKERERSTRTTRDPGSSDSDQGKERRKPRADRDRERPEDDGRSRSAVASSMDAEPALSRYGKRSNSVVLAEPTLERDAASPTDLSDRDGKRESTREGGRVQIVAPPKEANPAPKGILRKPTAKFPEDPDPIREGVAPHKSTMKGKDIPVDARWTKIDRRLVNPEALEEAKERFEERMDCVIVLRVLSKDDIQKLADRTVKIRDMREEHEREDHDRRDRDREHGRDRERERERDRDRDRDYDRDYDRDHDRARHHRHHGKGEGEGFSSRKDHGTDSENEARRPR